MTPLRVSVVIPVLDEEQSLHTTIDAVLAHSAADIHELLVVVCSRTSAAVRRLLDTIQSQHPGRVVVLEQRLPGLGGALRRGIDAASGTNVESISVNWLFTDVASLGIPTVEKVLLYHVVPGSTITYRTALKSNGAKLATALPGASIRVKVRYCVFVQLSDADPDDANPYVVRADLNKGNRQIAHGIDRVLRPVNL